MYKERVRVYLFLDITSAFVYNWGVSYKKRLSQNIRKLTERRYV
jgi:hypothetical protein